jgi:hypothetical protein
MCPVFPDALVSGGICEEIPPTVDTRFWGLAIARICGLSSFREAVECLSRSA